MIRVVLVDDHVVVRSGFAQLLSLEDDLEVIGQYSSAAQAWSALIRDDVNVAVIDIAMPDENGLSLLKRLRAQKPQFRAIILSIYDAPTFVQSALDAAVPAFNQTLWAGRVSAGGALGRAGRALSLCRCDSGFTRRRATRPGAGNSSPHENVKSLIYWSKETALKRSPLNSHSVIKRYMCIAPMCWEN